MYVCMLILVCMHLCAHVAPEIRSRVAARLELQAGGAIDPKEFEVHRRRFMIRGFKVQGLFQHHGNW